MAMDGEHIAQNPAEVKATGDRQPVPDQNIDVAPLESSPLNIAKPVDTTPPKAESNWYPNEAERELNKFERSTIRLAKLAFAASVLAAVFVGLQWYEMHTGSVDTKALAVAAGKQADRTKDLADRMKDQAAQTKTIAEQAIVQADAAKAASETAVAALKQSRNAFVIEQRPYLVGETPIWIVQPGATAQAAANFYTKNIGKSPAAKIQRRLKLLRYRGLPLSNPRGGDVYVAFIRDSFHGLDEQFLQTSREKYARLIRYDLAPGDRSFATAPDNGWNGLYQPLTELEMSDLRDGRVIFYLVAKTRYSDSSNGIYETENCWYYFGTDPAIWHICDSHNLIK